MEHLKVMDAREKPLEIRKGEGERIKSIFIFQYLTLMCSAVLFIAVECG